MGGRHAANHADNILFREGGRRDPLEGGERALLQNKLTRAQYLDEVTWTTKNWLGL